jgi:hypothetical protein
MAENLTRLVTLLVSELADWCVIHLLDEKGDLVSTAAVLPHGDAEGGAYSVARQERIPVTSNRLQARVLKTGRAQILEGREVLSDGEEGEEAEGVPEAGQVEVESVLCVPLGTRLMPMGTVTVARNRFAGPFDAREAILMERVGERAGVAVANARLYEMEHETAEALRAGLTPSSLPRIEGLEFAVRYVPVARLGHVGGDFFDILELSNARSAVLVGDIEGKGVQAAAAVGLARDTLRATIKLEPDPKVALAQLNEALEGLDRPRLCTLAYILLDRIDTGFEARVTLAGHPPPLLITSDGGRLFLGEPCPPAGVSMALEPKETRRLLHPGDTLIVYTDGFALPNATPMASLDDFAVGAQDEHVEDMLDRLLEELATRVEAMRDDIALVAVRVT